MGPPGAGKGTHAAPLSLHLKIPHISTGEIFRDNIRNQTAVGEKAKIYINQGNLVPDEIVLQMLFERTSKADCKEGYILDGFPRTVAQAKTLEQKIGATHQLIALYFAVPNLFLVERITGRLACKQCSKPYHRKYDPPKQAGICDGCAGLLYQRDDDKEDILRKRLAVYKRESFPLIEYYREKGVLQEIDSRFAKEEVFQEVLQAFRANEFFCPL